MDYTVARWYEELDALLSDPDVSTERVQVKISDLLVSLRANGQSDQDISNRVDPRHFRFDQTRFKRRFEQ